MLYEEKQIETIPVGPLGLIPLKSCEDLGKKVDAWLVEWRKERESEHKTTIAFAGYQKDSYIIGVKQKIRTVGNTWIGGYRIWIS